MHARSWVRSAGAEDAAVGGGAGARRRLQQGDLSNDRQHVTRALHIFYRYADNSTALTDSMVKLVRRAAVLQTVS